MQEYYSTPSGDELPAEPHPPVNVAPTDWDEITREVACPLCGYNLRGLTTARCPECGHEFLWHDVLEPDLLTHPFLFEHHPERNIRSFLATLFRPLNGPWFWSGVRPEHAVRPRRLVIYWVLTTVMSLLAIIAASEFESLSPTGQYRTRSGPQIFIASPYTPRTLPVQNLITSEPFRVTLLWALYPWANYLALNVFSQSMRKRRILPRHVLRVAIYSGDFIFWNAVFLGSASLLNLYEGWPWERICILMLVTFICNWWRLYAAYRSYLGFPSALELTLLASIMADLAMVTLFFFTFRGFMRVFIH